MNDDGLDGVIVRKFLKLADHYRGIHNYAIQIHHADLFPKAAE